MKQPELGKYIAGLRETKGLTQEELVSKCNISVRTLQRIESGKVVPRSYTLRLIATSMILDPFGDILAECRKLGDDFVIATATPDKLKQAGGYRYRNARRPELYADIIGRPHESEQKVAWLTETNE